MEIIVCGHIFSHKLMVCSLFRFESISQILIHFALCCWYQAEGRRICVATSFLLNSWCAHFSGLKAFHRFWYILPCVVGTKQKEEEFVFSDVSERPIPSILRGYSGPIRLDSDLTDEDLFFLLANDCDEFNRYAFWTTSFSFRFIMDPWFNNSVQLVCYLSPK